DADALVFSARGLPTGASFEDNGNGIGEFVWVPGYDQAGVYENIEFTVSDGKESARETISIRVQKEPSPVIDSRLYIQPIAKKTIKEGSISRIGVVATYAKGAVVDLTLDGAPAFVQLVVLKKTETRMSALLKCAPDYQDAGTYEFNVTLADSAGNQFVQRCVLVVRDVSPAPVIRVSSEEHVREKGQKIIPVTVSNADGDAVKVWIEGLPSFCAFNIYYNNSQWVWGGVRCKPGRGKAGTYEMTIIAEDAQGYRDVQTLLLNVIR
ncbi:MAG: hypothetical protein NC924_07695, partial [Candidatus Omnitrophica bacterium]|nr:hypothetical protein [Candidatus Omnitrophota bacterium]